MILVVGASGMLGGLVAAGLLAQGLAVRATVHWASPPPLPGAELVHADLAVPGTLRDAVTGVETVVATATAATRRLRDSGQSVRTVDEEGMEALVTEAERAGVRRFVQLSCAGVGRGPDGPFERAKLRIERRLAASPMRRVIVRPDAFQEVHFAAQGRFDLDHRRVGILGRGDNPRRCVAVEDVAALVVAVATEPDPPEVVEFGGPQALTRRSAVLLAEGPLGAHLRIQRLPRPAARLAMRALEGRDDALASLLGIGLGMDTVEAHWDDGPLRARGIRARPASVYLREQALAARARREG